MLDKFNKHITHFFFQPQKFKYLGICWKIRSAALEWRIPCVNSFQLKNKLSRPCRNGNALANIYTHVYYIITNTYLRLSYLFINYHPGVASLGNWRCLIRYKSIKCIFNYMAFLNAFSYVFFYLDVSNVICERLSKCFFFLNRITIVTIFNGF